MSRWSPGIAVLSRAASFGGSTVNDVIARGGQASQTEIGAFGPSAESAIAFGSAADAKLYRTGAAALRTDSALRVDGALTAGGTLSARTMTFSDEASAGTFYIRTTSGARIGLAPASTSTSIILDGILQWNVAGNQQTTVGAAGGASALPATPTKYLKVFDSGGTTLVIPAYAP